MEHYFQMRQSAWLLRVLNEHLKLFIDLSEVAQASEVMIEKEDEKRKKC